MQWACASKLCISKLMWLHFFYVIYNLYRIRDGYNLCTILSFLRSFPGSGVFFFLGAPCIPRSGFLHNYFHVSGYVLLSRARFTPTPCNTCWLPTAQEPWSLAVATCMPCHEFVHSKARISAVTSYLCHRLGAVLSVIHWWDLRLGGWVCWFLWFLSLVTNTL